MERGTNICIYDSLASRSHISRRRSHPMAIPQLGPYSLEPCHGSPRNSCADRLTINHQPLATNKRKIPRRLDGGGSYLKTMPCNTNHSHCNILLYVDSSMSWGDGVRRPLMSVDRAHICNWEEGFNMSNYFLFIVPCAVTASYFIRLLFVSKPRLFSL